MEQDLDSESTSSSELAGPASLMEAYVFLLNLKQRLVLWFCEARTEKLSYAPEVHTNVSSP